MGTSSSSGLSYAQVMVGRAMTGIIGMRETFEALYAEGVRPTASGLARRLVEELKAHNYVPNVALAVYEEAFLREYTGYCQARDAGEPLRAWRDPRKEHKPWYPTLFEAQCDGCGICLPVCRNGVLGWNADHTKVLVLEPYECAPGCQLCAAACPPRAIVMPPRALLHQSTNTAPSSGACASCSDAGCTACKEG